MNSAEMSNLHVSDKQMKKIFGSSFMQFAKNNRFLYPITDHGKTGNDPYLYYPFQEVVKAVQIFHRYSMRTSRDDLDFLQLSVHGLVPQDEFKHMKQSQWWEEIDRRFRKVSSLTEHKIGLDDIISPYVVDVIYRPQSHRRRLRR